MTRTTSRSLTPARPLALLALALAGATALSGLPATAAQAQAPLQRVVVTAGDGTSAAVRAVRTAGGSVLDRLPLVGGVSAELPAGALLGAGYLVAPDRPLTVAGGQDEATAGAPSTVRETLGLGAPDGEGAGTTVAVVDTGVADSPDLAGRLTHLDVTGEGTGDGFGHGTFVAGLVAGDGRSSGGRYAGVAPGARILDVRVAAADGSTSLVTVLKGLEAVATRDVDVVNLSLASGSPLPPQVDPLVLALDALWQRGTTVVVPSGNDPSMVASPGLAPGLLTAGGLDEAGTADHTDDSVAAWSGRSAGRHGGKPDLVAPGAHLVSLRAPGSTVDTGHADARVGDGYFRGSGTSFATAVTSGAAATLLARRALAPDQLKELLTSTAYDAPGLTAGAGAGGLDLATALHARTPRAHHNRAARAGTEVPGDPAVWSDLLSALLDGDRATAASSWSQLSPAARNWVARNWVASSWSARNWVARNWVDEGWDGADGTAEQWAARNWAARNWAARNWVASSWSASSWSASSWSARNWVARNWVDADWAARNWVGDDWAARNWVSDSWAARNWVSDSWAARNWVSDSWVSASWSSAGWE